MLQLFPEAFAIFLTLGERFLTPENSGEFQKLLLTLFI
jgi:hypothetical protein